MVALNAASAVSATPIKGRNHVCPTAFWNFGDSLTDTGGTLDVFALSLDPERSTYGESIFGRPANRLCLTTSLSGQLLGKVLDTLEGIVGPGRNYALAFKYPLLQPYLQAGAFDYNYGANFASGGTTASNDTSRNPIYLLNQVAQFVRFKQSATSQKNQFGWNTIAMTVLASIPELQKDAMGCIVFINELDQAYNEALNDTIASARLLYPGRIFSIFNYYAANLEILTNPSLYGFNPALTKRACCGAPGLGTLNFNPLVTCGSPGSNKCANPDEYVNWDGVHFTEAFYRQIALWTPAGKFTNHPVNYTSLCKLDFRSFAKSSTYNSVFPHSFRVALT
ncbi:hypothetical protein AXG93_2954s1020 [Marchantia polymorpha subsp. ruderalis]|uniref:GDSL esterase/lipase n=1 Tax=Marchantia polymorpha subsp. ruderalis TaxID=1480154 RepID=A0A176W452_MARPO|nr:hypothetical protein AXG93_2954s1020 [Marchantia polymorpha subsp. ruderalis]